MKYISFEKSLKKFPVFSITDIRKIYPDFDSRRLVEWQKKNYITKLRREYYFFNGKEKDENFLFFASNKIYSPSYISMENALSFYGFIPEQVFVTTAISTRNTANFTTAVGDFIYYHIKPSVFFGYRILQNESVSIKTAEPEKAILDYFYFKKLNSLKDIEELRFNEIMIKESVDFEKLENYQKLFNSKVLDRRINLLKTIINA